MYNVAPDLILNAIFRSAVDGIIIIDNKGIIQEVNEAACKMFLYEKSSLVSANVSMLMEHEHSKHHNTYIENYESTKVPKIIGIGREVKGKKSNGEVFPFWLSVSEVQYADGSYFAGMIHDLTEIKRVQQVLKQLNTDLEGKVTARTYELEKVVNKLLALNNKFEQELATRMEVEKMLKAQEIELQKKLESEKELNELKSRFLSMASHEFRTPLSTILSSAGLIERYTDSNHQENRAKHINRIKSSVSHLTEILNDFLSLDKVEEGKIMVIPEMLDPVILLQEVLDELKVIFKDRHLDFQDFRSVKTDLFTDKKLVKNIFINLISNAIKYTKMNGNISCSFDSDDKFFKCSFQDDGIGIPEEDQKYLFERFFRASNVVNIEGTGLGLNIVKKFVELLNGSIDYVSKPNHGSTFIVHLPIVAK